MFLFLLDLFIPFDVKESESEIISATYFHRGLAASDVGMPTIDVESVAAVEQSSLEFSKSFFLGESYGCGAS